ncbi:hypothetical protein [Deinococcus marmoris]|uniref:hypothetical protein n=1 Tax=Deinococcus marmoris TaxID=249408 RepID=UPI0012DDBF4D|nr:hypothetical protein [Deinococcus marmoris]
MFNLTVSEAHTFYVGQGGWLVHNAGGGGAPAAALYGPQWKPASLKDAIAAVGADPKAGIPNPKGSKMLYFSQDGTRAVIYDPAGKYFRVQDLTHPGAAKGLTPSYLDELGQPLSDKSTVTRPNGKTVKVSMTPAQQQAQSHFSNIDCP